MPPVATWIHRVAEIIELLEASAAPLVDRPTIEETFQVQRRTAINLMHQFGAYKVAETLVLPKQQLIERLQKIQRGDAAFYEGNRRERLTSLLAEARQEVQRKRLLVRIDPRQEGVTFATLDPAIELVAGTGELRIRYTGFEDLLTKLGLLSRAMQNDSEELFTRTRVQE